MKNHFPVLLLVLSCLGLNQSVIAADSKFDFDVLRQRAATVAAKPYVPQANRVPEWLLRLICRLAPNPDVVILLDAPAETLHARKQEVPLEETARQLDAYRALVEPLRNGYVADASRPREAVASNVCDILLHHLTTRTARRLDGKGDL